MSEFCPNLEEIGINYCKADDDQHESEVFLRLSQFRHARVLILSKITSQIPGHLRNDYDLSLNAAFAASMKRSYHGTIWSIIREGKRRRGYIELREMRFRWGRDSSRPKGKLKNQAYSLVRPIGNSDAPDELLVESRNTQPSSRAFCVVPDPEITEMAAPVGWNSDKCSRNLYRHLSEEPPVTRKNWSPDCRRSCRSMLCRDGWD